MRKMQKSNASQKNIHAILQQRRLRHITGICVRNLGIQQYDSSIPSQDTFGKLEERSTPKIYFKISVKPDKREPKSKENCVVFESEHIDLCSNPQWLNFDIPKSESSAGCDFHLQLWLNDMAADRTEVVFSWKWNLSRLSYIAERLYNGEITFSPNALVVQISGSFYSLSQCFSTDTPHGNCPHFNVDEEKGSCNVFSLNRMITCHRSITQAKQRTLGYKQASQSLMQNTELHRRQIRHIEDVQKRIKRLKQLLSRETSMLVTEQNKLQNLHKESKNKQTHLGQNRTIVLQERDQFNEASDKMIVFRQRTGLLNSKLRSRHMEVLSELAYIFPILPHTLPITNKNTASTKGQSQPTKQTPTFTICDIYLPEAESLITKDDSKNAVAMGYISQMLYMISYFLLIPLRYPLALQGSQTSIIDNILDKIQEKERVFPLYSKSNKERFLFEYAIYLLNKNIGQMRFLLGIPTSDLRPTLYNLKTLLEHAFGAQQQGRTSSMRSSSYAAPKTPPKRRSPQPQRKESDHDSEMNGIRKIPVDLEEKVHDKSVELHSLRGELFGSRKSSRPVPISPRRASPNSTRKATASPSPAYLTVPNETTKVLRNTSHEDVSVIMAETGDANAVFLTGLEDLDQSPKASAKSQKPIDVVAARNELFKTKSGRAIITKKHTYTMRAATSSSSSQSENYFSTKEQLFKKDCIEDGAPSQTSELENPNTTENGLSESPTNVENNNLKIGHAPLAMSEEIDLC